MQSFVYYFKRIFFNVNFEVVVECAFIIYNTLGLFY